MSKNIFIFSVICFTLLFISTNGFPQNSGQYPIINSGYRPYYQTILPAYSNPPSALVSQQNCEGGNCNGKPFCSAGYHLENGVCILDLQCEPGYAIENGKCVPSGRLNCTSTSCANNNCQIVCPLGFVLVNGLCQSKSQPPCEQRTCEIKTVCHPTECTPTVIQPATICPPNSGNIQPPAAVTSCPNNAPSCSIQPVRSIQTIQPVQQIQPVQPTLTVQPAQQIQPVQPIHTVPSVQQIQPVQPIVQPVQPIQIYQPLPSLQPSCNQCPQGQLCPQCPSSQCPQCPQQQGCPQCPPQQPCPACPQQTPCPACIQAPCAPCPTVQCPQCPQQRPCPPCTQQPCAPCPPVQCPQCPPQLPCPSCPLPPPCPTCPTLPPLNITEVICPPGFRKSNGVCLQISCPDKGVYQNGSCTASNTVSSTINTQNVVHNHNVIRQPVKVNINNENTVYIHTADGTVVSVNGTQTEPIRGNITTIQPKACTNSTCQPPPTIVEKPKCCTIVTPRICKKNDTRWDCNNRRYTRCGPICQHPKMYLRPRTVISRPPVLVIPPYCNGPSCNWVEGRDCSGCAAESSCPSYCHAPNCDTGDCGFYDQQQYCEENPGSYGCYEHDGCYDDWCNS